MLFFQQKAEVFYRNLFVDIRLNQKARLYDHNLSSYFCQMGVEQLSKGFIHGKISIQQRSKYNY